MSKFGALELDVAKPARMIVVHPVTRQPLREIGDDPDAPGKEAFIDLYSGDSDQARRHQRAIQRRRLAMRGRGRVTPEEIEADAIEFLCAVTAGWYLLDLQGRPLNVEFSPEAARELYANDAVAWLRDQVDEYVGDRGNFSKASPTS